MIKVIENLSLHSPLLRHVSLLLGSQLPVLLIDCKEEPELLQEQRVISHNFDPEVVLVIIAEKGNGQWDLLSLHIKKLSDVSHALNFLLINIHLFLIVGVLGISLVELHCGHVQEKSLKLQSCQHNQLRPVYIVQISSRSR